MPHAAQCGHAHQYTWVSRQLSHRMRQSCDDACRYSHVTTWGQAEIVFLLWHWSLVARSLEYSWGTWYGYSCFVLLLALCWLLRTCKVLGMTDRFHDFQAIVDISHPPRGLQRLCFWSRPLLHACRICEARRQWRPGGASRWQARK